jgi:hypothetical protein
VAVAAFQTSAATMPDVTELTFTLPPAANVDRVDIATSNLVLMRFWNAPIVLAAL